MNFVTTQRISVRMLKQGVLGTLSATPLMLAILGGSAGAAFAQAAPQSAQNTAAQPEEIVVTGSRVVRDGYQAPTPVTVVGVEQFQSTASANIADYLNTLPSLSGSETPQSSTTQINGGNAGINALNLRGLGTVRTLTLLDGQRLVGSINTGVVDTTELPQQLVSRVDVVTGGASAAYGSDALTGVVNFILDTKFTGIKGEVSGGVTTYGDDRNWKINLTAGTGFANDRGHFEISGEAAEQDGILVNNRPWNLQGYSLMVNPAYGTGVGQTTSVPEYIHESHVGLSNATLGGLITSGPLKGTSFGPGGGYTQLNYGSLVSNPLMSGGDWVATSITDVAGESLDDPETRQNLFARASYDITDNFEVYGQASWSHLHTLSRAVPNFYTGTLTIKSDNAFIPAPLAAALTAQGQTSFSLGTMNGDIGTESPLYDRIVQRYLLGADGKFDAFDTTWKWEGHLSSGIAKGTSAASDTFTVANYMNAIDSVRSPTTGAIVCRSTLTNPTNGCVPYDVFGTGVNSQAAINYVKGGAPFYINDMVQKDAAVSVNGEPFSSWAGPVSIATGIEHREESTRAIADPGEAAGSWFIGSGVPFSGKFSVTEGFVETVVPLAKDVAWAKNLEFNGAVRVTGYSTFGTTATWKTGLTYNPIDDLRFRGTESHDIREPTLVDLFAAGITSNNSLNDPFLNNASVTYKGTTIGNPSLEPEKAMTTGLGAVYQPSWFQGFNVSFDYYRVAITNAIASVSPQNLMNLCFAGNQTACADIVQTGTQNGLPVFQITSGPQNFASETAKGFDIESSYVLPLQTVVESWAGNVNVRFLATHAISDLLTSGIIGTIPVKQAGQNGGGAPPKWKYEAAVDYVLDPVTVGLTIRGVSAGVIDSNWITCTSGCPAVTSTHITSDYNQIAGATYFDFNASYKLHLGEDKTEAEMFFSVRNLMNKAPPIDYIGPNNSSWTFYPANNLLYDTLGRVFRAGVRFKM